jgi:predicted Zn-dependent peptidase
MSKLFFIFIIFLGEVMSNSLPKHYTKKLKNGLQIVAIPMQNGSGVISTDIFYRVGSRNEIMGKSGIAHMLEHLNFKSTKNLEAGEFDKIVKKYGGVNNASTGFDTTHYYIKSSKDNLNKSLNLFAELLKNLNLLDEEFQTERDVVAEERRWRTDNNPIGYLYFRLFNTAFVHHSYHWTPIGFMDDILNWKIEDIKDFHKTYYQPQNAIVVVSGDISKDEVFKAVKKEFKGIENSSKTIPTPYISEPTQDGERRVVIKKESEVDILAIAYHIPSYLHKDQVALSAISEMLSSGKSSILNTILIDQKRLVNSVYAYNMETIDPNLFLFLAVCNKDVDAQTVEKEILDIIESLKTKEVLSDELDRIKINTKADFIFSMEDSSTVSDIFGSAYARGGVEPLLNYESDLEALTPSMIKDVANRYFTKDNSTTIILKDK